MAVIYPDPKTTCQILDFEDGECLEWLKMLADDDGFKMKAIIEKVSAMPKQGLSSTFKFGVNFGTWIGRLEALGIPFDYVTPRKWKKLIFDSMPKGDTKEMSRDRARRIFPQMADKLKRKKDHNRAEALLLAEFARRTDN